MIELVSGMPARQLGDESSLSARIRAGSRFKQFLCFVLINVRYFSVPQVEAHWINPFKNCIYLTKFKIYRFVTMVY
jgi:hypothetical protein